MDTEDIISWISIYLSIYPMRPKKMAQFQSTTTQVFYMFSLWTDIDHYQSVHTTKV